MMFLKSLKTKAPRLQQESGQSTVEYILLVTAVIAIVIVFTVGNNSSVKSKLNNTYETVTNGVSDKAGILADSHEGSDEHGKQSDDAKQRVQLPDMPDLPK